MFWEACVRRARLGHSRGTRSRRTPRGSTFAIRRAADVVAFLVNRRGQVYRRLGRAEQRAGPPGWRESSGKPEDQPGSREASMAADRMPSLASSSSGPWNARLAISSETVNPMPAIAPVPANAAQPTGSAAARESAG